MRLHFWAARESGAFANKAFADYYVSITQPLYCQRCHLYSISSTTSSCELTRDFLNSCTQRCHPSSLKLHLQLELNRNSQVPLQVRFIGHFVSVYERHAPPFARESARWSADPANIKVYLDAGRRMPDIMGLDIRRALGQLPADERLCASSDTYPPTWPYELR